MINLKVTDKVCVNYLKTLGIDIIDKAKSGHPGIVLGAANIMYTLYTKILKIDPRNPKWLNRDRFVMSCGHGSSLLYSSLFCVTKDYTINDLKRFRRLNSCTPGHLSSLLSCGRQILSRYLGEMNEYVVISL